MALNLWYVLMTGCWYFWELPTSNISYSFNTHCHLEHICKSALSCNVRAWSSVFLMNAVFWDGSCKNRRFGGKCRLHLQGRKNPRARKTLAVGKQTKPYCEKKAKYMDLRTTIQSVSRLLSLLFARRFFLPWRWRRRVISIRRFIWEPHNAKSQKTATVKTSRLLDCQTLQLTT
jgi:hypothetical protein